MEVGQQSGTLVFFLSGFPVLLDDRFGQQTAKLQSDLVGDGLQGVVVAVGGGDGLTQDRCEMKSGAPTPGWRRPPRTGTLYWLTPQRYAGSCRGRGSRNSFISRTGGPDSEHVNETRGCHDET